MKRLFLISLFMGCIAGPLTLPAEAAVILLKDGSRVRGTVVSATARDVQVHTSNGPLTIATDRIETISYSDTEAAPDPERLAPPAERFPPSAPVPGTLASRLIIREAPRQQFSLGVGAALPLGEVDFSAAGGGSGANGSPGMQLDGRYLYNVAPRLGAGLDMAFSHRSGSDSQNLLPFSNTDVFGNSLVFLGALKYSFIDRGYARPYLLGGIGTHRTSTIIEARPNPGFAWSDTDTDETRTLVDDAHWGLATSLRLGMDFEVAPPVTFSFEVGWTRLAAPSYTATAAGQDLGLNSVTGNQEAITVAARWGWRF